MASPAVSDKGPIPAIVETLHLKSSRKVVARRILGTSRSENPARKPSNNEKRQGFARVNEMKIIASVIFCDTPIWVTRVLHPD
jgi:hypothetical protein